MHAKLFLEGKTEHWDDSGGRILFKSNTGSSMVMLWPVRFQCADSLDLNWTLLYIQMKLNIHDMLNLKQCKIQLVLDLPECNYRTSWGVPDCNCELHHHLFSPHFVPVGSEYHHHHLDNHSNQHRCLSWAQHVSFWEAAVAPVQTAPSPLSNVKQNNFLTEAIPLCDIISTYISRHTQQ